MPSQHIANHNARNRLAPPRHPGLESHRNPGGLFAAKHALIALLATLSLVSQAAPAPWFWWVSKVDGKRVCLQVSPGEGWTLAGGPFDNSHCH